MLRRHPVEWSHGEVAVLPLSYGELFLEISEVIEFVASIELLVVLSVAAFYFAVMSGRIYFDSLVLNAELGQGFLK